MANQTILLIDDDEDILQVMTYILLDEGYEVIAGKDAAVLHEIEKNPPALILIDNWLKHHSGHDICKQLKANPKTSFIPVLFISAANLIEETAKSAGADGFLAKPFDIAELLAKVKMFISA